uniref:Cell differentiation protein rcd1 n=1 Tax=Solanum lycopersicum TaxID=4081 RepID=A0A3Q7J5N7_SOLLC
MDGNWIMSDSSVEYRTGLPSYWWERRGTEKMEIVSIYPVLSPPNLTPAQSNRVCNALALLQLIPCAVFLTHVSSTICKVMSTVSCHCVASHPDTRMLFLNGLRREVLNPYVDDTEVISFLLSTEIIPLCLRTMEMGSELSKTVATFIVQKILLDDVGLDYICTTAERFFAVGRVLGNMVGALAEQPSSRLLKHIIRCYLRLSDNPSFVMYKISGLMPRLVDAFELMLMCIVYVRACDALRNGLPDMLRDNTFSTCLRDDPTTRRWLQQLINNVNGARVALQAGGFDHMLMN